MSIVVISIIFALWGLPDAARTAPLAIVEAD